MKGSLVFVGVGIVGIAQATREAEAHIAQADLVLHLVLDPVTVVWLKSVNPTATSLDSFYAPGKPRVKTYREMTRRITEPVLKGKHVCVAMYGHPGVLVATARESIRRVRKAGLPARLVPGISAEACLYADLNVDPGAAGVQSFEATDFLLYRRRIDPTSALILWQIGVLGEGITRDAARPFSAEKMRALVLRLQRDYPPGHRVTLYRAPTFPTEPPTITRLRLDSLPRANIRPLMTLFVPPRAQRRPDPRILAWLAER